MANTTSKPAPMETDPGKQKDDNIDDLGHRPDGSTQDQPTDGATEGDKQQEHGSHNGH